MFNLSTKQMRNFEGYLEKRKNQKIALFKKRYFKILDGQILIYFENQHDTKYKGYYIISEITEPMPNDEKSFSFKFKEHEIEIRTKSYMEREKWLYSISHCREFATNNKMMLKNIAYVLRENGLLGVEDKERNKDILESLNFGKNTSLLNLNEEKYQMRFFSCFVMDNTLSKHKRRFLIIYSRRPLANANYLFDRDTNSEFYECSPKEWLQYETVHLFHYDKTNGKYITILKESINLSNIAKIHIVEKKEKHIYLINEDTKISHDFSLEIKEERDELFEYLMNSYKTAQLMSKSITKQPRNTTFLDYFYKHDKHNEIKSFIEKEIASIIVEKQIQKFQYINIFNYKFQKVVEPIIDGCLSNEPPYITILNYFLNELNSFYYKELEAFWQEHKDTINQQEIVILSMQLKSWSKKLLNSYNICDYDLEQNLKKIMKIFIKNTYHKIIKSINELIDKSLIDDISTPKELISLFTSLLNNLQIFVHKYTYEQVVILIYNCLVQYLLEIDLKIVDFNQDINNDSLIKIVNNLLKIRLKLNSLLAQIIENDVLNQKEIIDLIQFNPLLKLFNIAIKNSLFRLIYKNVNKIEKYFDKEDESINISTSVHTLIENDLSYVYLNLHKENKQEFINHLLYWTIGYYIKMIFNVKHIKKYEIINNLKEHLNDIKNIFQSYLKIFPQNALKLIDDIINLINIISLKKIENENIQTLSETLEQMLKHFDLSFTTSLINTITEFIGLTNENKSKLINILQNQNFNSIVNEFNLIFWNIWNKESQAKNPFLISIYDYLSEENLKLYNSCYIEPEFKVKDVSIIKEGFLQKKYINKWKSFYFQLNPTQLLQFKDNSCKELLEKIDIQNIVYYKSYKPNHLLLLIRYLYKNEIELKIRKYMCEYVEEIEEWLKCLRKTIENNKDYKQMIIIDEKRKLIKEKVEMNEEFVERYSIINFCFRKNQSLNVNNNERKSVYSMKYDKNNVNTFGGIRGNSVLIKDYFVREKSENEKKQTVNKEENEIKRNYIEDKELKESIKEENHESKEDKKTYEELKSENDKLKEIDSNKIKTHEYNEREDNNSLFQQFSIKNLQKIKKNEQLDQLNQKEKIISDVNIEKSIENNIQQNNEKPKLIEIKDDNIKTISLKQSFQINEPLSELKQSFQNQTQKNSNADIQIRNLEIELRRDHEEENEEENVFGCLKCLFCFKKTFF